MSFFSRFTRKSGKSDETLYAQVWCEIESKNVDEGLWARLWSENKGDEEKTKAAYLKERVKQLRRSSNSAEPQQSERKTLDRESVESDSIKQKIEVACPKCGGRIRLAAGRSGNVDCPHCNRIFYKNTTGITAFLLLKETLKIFNSDAGRFILLGLLPFLVTLMISMVVVGNGVFTGLLSSSDALTYFSISSLLGFPLVIFLQGVIISYVMPPLSEGSSSIEQSLQEGLKAFWPLLGASVLWLIGCTLGLLLVGVVGCILFCMWMMVNPIIVIERCGIFSSFSRSRQLTKGMRWTICRSCGVVIVVNGGMVALIGSTASAGASSLTVSLIYGVAVLNAVFWPIFMTVVYNELRAVKLSPPPSALFL